MTTATAPERLRDQPMSDPQTDDIIEEHIGQKIVTVCARYMYWGVLTKKQVIDGQPCLLLSDAVVVEESGAASSDKPVRVDPLHGSIVIFMSAIETICQPNWSQGKLPSEE